MNSMSGVWVVSVLINQATYVQALNVMLDSKVKNLSSLSYRGSNQIKRLTCIFMIRMVLLRSSCMLFWFCIIFVSTQYSVHNIYNNGSVVIVYCTIFLSYNKSVVQISEQYFSFKTNLPSKSAQDLPNRVNICKLIKFKTIHN